MKTYRTTKLVLQDDQGNVLLLRRSETHPTQALHMDLPGGVIDGEEQPVEALLRELDEETGIKLSANDLGLVFAAAGPHHEKNAVENAVRLVYAAKVSGVKPRVTLSWEHGQYEWVPVAQVAHRLHTGNYKQQAIEYLIKHKVLEDR